MHYSALPLAGLIATSHAFTVSAPASVPSDASNVVNKGFLGMAIESTSFPAYTGNKTHPNTFSLNLFASIVNRTGTFPIRIGGDSRDMGLYVPTQEEAVVETNPANLMAKNYLGPSFLDGLGMIPGARWVLGVPFQMRNLSNAIEFLEASLKVMPSGSLDAVELGNEPNEYGGGYTPADYVAQWIEWADAISGNISAIGEDDFWALSVASYESDEWDVESVYKTTDLGKYANRTKAASMHYYQAGNTTDLQSTLLNHAAVAGRINSSFAHDAQYLAAHTQPRVPLILGEGGPAIGANSSAVQHSLGTAVWYVDVCLAAMVAGIYRINVAGGHDSPHAASPGATWLPVGRYKNGDEPAAPSVNPAFYSNILVADLLAAATGGLRVAELDVGPSARLANGSLAAYAAYNASSLASVVLLNEEVWLSTDGGDRPSVDVKIGGLGHAHSVRLDYLTGDDSYAADVSWANQRWTVASNGLPVPSGNTTRTLTVSDGAVTVPVAATEVVVMTLLS